MIGAPSERTQAEFRAELERQRGIVGRRVTALFGAVTDPDDTAGFRRLTVGGTKAIGEVQAASARAAEDLLIGTLIDNEVPADDVAVPIETGRLQSGQPVQGVLDGTQSIVGNRMSGGATFSEAMQSSATAVLGVAMSEPWRIGRQGVADFGARDSRFDRWRRIAEPGACAWCRMLATRGAVYHTESTARISGHAHCHCEIQELVDPAAIEWSKASGALRWRAELAAGTQWQPKKRAAQAAQPQQTFSRRDSIEAQLRIMRRTLREDDRINEQGRAWLRERIASLEAELAGMAA